MLKFDLRSRDEVFYLGICGSNSLAGSKSPAGSENLYEFFGDGIGPFVVPGRGYSVGI